jgi:hypothetical protein
MSTEMVQHRDVGTEEKATQGKKLARGLALAFAPTVLFFPVYAFLNICPPEYAAATLLIILLLFGAAEVAAARDFVANLSAESSWRTGTATLGLAVCALTILVCSAGFMASIHEIIEGYPPLVTR